MSRDGDMVPVDTSEVFRGNRNPSQSWIRIDATGQHRELDLNKYEIMRRVQIHARDLRILDPNISSPSSILSREKAIVLNLEHIRVIITAEEVLLRGSLDDNIIPVVEEFKRRLDVESRARYGQADGNEDSGAEDDDADAAEKDESPFEFRALEVALEAICSFLAARTTELETSAYPALDELTSKTSSRNLDRMRVLKNNMTKLTVRVQKVKDELEQLLDEEDDMADLYLSRKLAGASSPVSDSSEPINSCPTSPTIAAKISRAKSHLVNPLAAIHGKGHNDVEEIEMLLEAYYMQIDSTLNKLATLREYIDDTEDYINIQLDTFRNQLMKFELILSAGSICVSVYSLVAGILGMNIPFSWNKKEFMFKWVVSVTGTLCAVLFVVIMSYARYKRLVGT